MLKRITDSEDRLFWRIRIKDAAFPAPFPRSLEYNAPAHGTWNIVHIGMAVPQSHSIYVCADNCLRGVVMTAAEMGCLDRFSSVTITERDLQTDNLETITIEGVSDVIAQLPQKPPVVFLFLVCLHIFAGCDEDYVFRTLTRRWPGIRFVKAYMDCVRQKEGPTPDMKLRMAEYGIIDPLPLNRKRVNILGSDVRFLPDGELVIAAVSDEMIAECGAVEDDLDDVAVIAGQVEGVETSITLREAEGGWKASVRTVNYANADKICAQLGGGGHGMAAGCVMICSLEEAKSRILEAARKVWKQG